MSCATPIAQSSIAQEADAEIERSSKKMKVAAHKLPSNVALVAPTTTATHKETHAPTAPLQRDSSISLVREGKQ
ncbi:hypothetical protein BHE74_00043304 [Ensete ventricosum]|nr:hypothetical protein BHE74_00043304 [Ensete ventricosum]